MKRTTAILLLMTGSVLGQNQALLRLFAATLGVPVYSATGSYNNIFGFNTGDYVVCQPSGACSPTTRP